MSANLLWLLGIPASIFVGISLISLVMNWSIRIYKWWALPTYLAIAVPIAFAMAFGVLFSGWKAFGSLFS